MHYFFSDVHLGLGSREKSRERERHLLRFFEMVGASRAETLYIVGDLFDYWFDYRTVVPREFVRTLGGIAALVEAGVRVEYVIGNHDFGHRDFFEGELGVHVHHDDIERTIDGHRVYIAHGDGKAFNDTGYMILKKVLRAPISNRLFRFFHPDVGIGLAIRASRSSRDYTDKKHYGGERPGEKDGLHAFARQKITEEGYDLVIMGHNHIPMRADYPEGSYINLGTWLKPERPYLVIGDGVVDMRSFL
jgi:UDP-2,3-diacylglucosamine hydrolase